MKKACRGYTLIELLVVTSIMMVLFLIVFASYADFNRRQILDQALLELKSNLRLAQTKALSGEKPSVEVECDFLHGYRVTFPNQSEYVIQAKCDDNGADVGTSYYLPSTLTFSEFPTTAILFKVLGLGVQLEGQDLGGEDQITIAVSGYNSTRKIYLNRVGEIKSD